MKKVNTVMTVSERGKRKDKLWCRRILALGGGRGEARERKKKKKKGMGHPFVNMRVV